MISLFIFIYGIFAAEATGAPEKQWDRSCRMEFYGHYFAKNCVPQGNGTCPEYFSCPQVQRVTHRCFYRERAYDIRDRVPVNNKCSPDCFCRAPFRAGDIARIECAIVDCPSVFLPPDPYCISLFSHDKCCSVDKYCFGDGGPPRSTPVTCHINNKMYFKGQFVDFPDYPCQSCICQEGFNGPFGPGCKTADCGFDFRYTVELAAGCVPIYFESGCCPIGFVCPDDPDLQPASAPSTDGVPSQQKQDGVCYLGNRQFQIGERLQRKRCQEVCVCKTPPDLTCIAFSNCQDATRNNIFPNNF